MASVATATKPLKKPLPPVAQTEPVMGSGPSRGQVVFERQADGTAPVVSMIRWSGQAIEIHSATLFGQTSSKIPENRIALKKMVERLFGDEIVGRVAVDRSAGIMTIYLATGWLTTTANLERVTKMISGKAVPRTDAPVMLWNDAPEGSFDIVRDGQILTTWQVAESGNGQWAIRQPQLQGNLQLAELAVSFTEQLPYISRARVDRHRGMLYLTPLPGRAIDRPSLIHSLEQLSSDAGQFLM
ncbi:MAG: hypothetical protein ACKO5E_18735, partial [bacterium]